MPKMNVLIIDDEPLAREGIRSLLSHESDIHIAGECSSGREALKEILEKKPSLIFLDIQMPEMNGFDVLAQLDEEKLPYVIFVTAYDQYALRAFEVYALDYLLKPIDEERFTRTLQRARAQIEHRLNSDLNEGLRALIQQFASNTSEGVSNYLERMMIKTDGRVFFLVTDEIDWIEAQGNYVMLHVGKESYLLRDAISKVEVQLNPRKFLRIHRSTIVNIDRVKELQSLFHGDYRVLLKDGTKLLLSRRYRWKARASLGKEL
jgi:two-component system, LytTR family, response regulator